MEEMILRAGRGGVYFLLAYFGLKLLGVPTSKSIIIAFAPLVAGLTNLFSRELGLLAMLALLLGLANYAMEGRLTKIALNIYNQAMINEEVVQHGVEKGEVTTKKELKTNP